MPKIVDFSEGCFYNKQLNASTKMTLLRFFVTISLHKINEDNLNLENVYPNKTGHNVKTNSSISIL